MTGEVLSVTDGDPHCGHADRRPRWQRARHHHRAPQAVPPTSPTSGCSIEPAQADVVIVKIGYLEPELHELAADWTLALTPAASTKTSSGSATTTSRPGSTSSTWTHSSPNSHPLVTRR